MKDVSVAKRPRPHLKKFEPAIKAGKQTRKGGKGTSLMHVAAKRQGRKEVAKSNMSPTKAAMHSSSPNRADQALKQLERGGKY